MKFYFTNFFLIAIFAVFNGCSPFGPGSLTNHVSIKTNQRLINVELPRGYCIDRNAGASTDYAKTSVITNNWNTCLSKSFKDADLFYIGLGLVIMCRQKNSTVFGRRPVDSVINLTHTDIKLPGSLSEKDFLNNLIRDEKLEAFVTNSKSIRLRTIDKAVRNGFVVINLQQTSETSSVKKVRKYVFLVDQRIAIMTIVNIDRKFKPEYKKFENLIKLLKKTSS